MDFANQDQLAMAARCTTMETGFSGCKELLKIYFLKTSFKSAYNSYLNALFFYYGIMGCPRVQSGACFPTCSWWCSCPSLAFQDLQICSLVVWPNSDYANKNATRRSLFLAICSPLSHTELGVHSIFKFCCAAYEQSVNRKPLQKFPNELCGKLATVLCCLH